MQINFKVCILYILKYALIDKNCPFNIIYEMFLLGITFKNNLQMIYFLFQSLVS